MLRGGDPAGRRGAALQADLRSAAPARRSRSSPRWCFSWATCCATTVGDADRRWPRSPAFSPRRLRDPEVRFRFDRWHGDRPCRGRPVLASVEMARFSRTLGTLLRQRRHAGRARWPSCARPWATRWLAEAVGNVARELKEGRGLGRPMMETGRFPMLAVHMIMVGEETGRLDEMLHAGRRDLRQRGRVSHPQARSRSSQPVMIVIMAVHHRLHHHRHPVGDAVDLRPSHLITKGMIR